MLFYGLSCVSSSSMAIASPGNDFRLGACEAPPAIISAYLGDDMTRYLEAYMKGEQKAYQPSIKLLNMGAGSLPPIEVPAEDRNRTSPFRKSYLLIVCMIVV